MENTRVPFALPEHHVFGGFWVRFAAYCIDSVVIAVPILLGFGGVALLAASLHNDTLLAVGMFVGVVAAVVWSFAYFVLMYGVKSTTLGKMLFGMTVVREDNGKKVSWGQSFGRTLSYLLSRIFYIGYIIAAFDDEKRALHDHLAKTRVVRDTRKSMTAGWVLFGIISAFAFLVAFAVTFMIPTTWSTEITSDMRGAVEHVSDDPAGIVASADYDEGYRAGYADGRTAQGTFGDSYAEPATQSRRADYETGYVDGYLAGCSDGNFDCSDVENTYYGTGATDPNAAF